MSSYARRMAHLSKRIFVEVTRPTKTPSMKVVEVFAAKPVEKRTEVTHYYPQHTQTQHLFSKLRSLGLFRDEHQDFRDEMKRLRALRGKVKPKKGEGKRAMKRK